MKLILRSVLVFALAFAAYNAALAVLPPHWKLGGRAGSQYEQNLMRAQAYLALPAPPPVVVAGTSVASRLESLPADWFNLAFSGGSTFTGLEILARSDAVPPVVLVETNVLVTRDLDRPMVDAAFDPALRRARQVMPGLLEANKPAHVLLRAADPASRTGFTIHPPGRSRPALAAPPSTSPATSPTSTPAEVEPDLPVGMPPDLYRELVRMQVAHEAVPVPPSRLDEIEANLRRHVEPLERRGATVIFFEAPEHPDVMAQTAMRAVRERLAAAFPPPRYAWVPAVDPRDYRTTDGVHLTGPGTVRYGRVLEDAVAAAKRTRISP
jgi:hypothetical protein